MGRKICILDSNQGILLLKNKQISVCFFLFFKQKETIIGTIYVRKRKDDEI